MLDDNPTIPSVTVDRTVRPLRLGFLVDPSSRTQLHAAFCLSTATWGGRFHGLIPVMRRRRKAWSAAWHGQAAADITQGYLEAFEPDLLVEMAPGLRDGLALPEGRVVAASDLDGLLSGGLGGIPWIGIPVDVLYADLYEREERFVRKDARRPVLVDPPSRLSLFSAAWFGAFPEAGSLQSLREAYLKTLDPELVTLTPASAIQIVREVRLTPIRVGLDELKRWRAFHHDALVLFVLDPRAPIDVLDFWNLRALGWPVVPLPVEWTSDIVSEIVGLTKEAFRPSLRPPQPGSGTTLLRSRTVTPAQFKGTAEALTAAGAAGLTLQSWLPPIGERSRHPWDGLTRVRIAAAEQSDSVLVSGRSITFRDASPPFVVDESTAGTWAMTVRIRAYQEDVAGVLPLGLNRIDLLLGSPSLGGVWQETDGFVVSVTAPRFSRRWELPPHLSVFESWARARGFTFQLSGAGRIGQQVMRRLGGPIGAASIASIDLLKKLYTLTSDSRGGKGESQAARSRIGTMTSEDLHKLLMRAHQENTRGMSPKDKEASGRRAAYWAGRHRATLLERRVLDVGLEVQCPVCLQRNWYGLGGIASDLRCEWCLDVFRFPSADPGQAAWRYRPAGPFAIEGYAQGTLVTAATLRALALMRHGSMTWVTAFELSAPGFFGEVDFGLFWQPDLIDSGPTTLVLGESKGGDAHFEKKDVRKARELLSRIPGAAFVFSTTRELLTDTEKRHIGGLAKWCAKGRSSRGSDAHAVIVLTRCELEAERPLPYCWDGMPNAAQATQAYKAARFDDLRGLADATRILYLA